jgi:hypothetical protein
VQAVRLETRIPRLPFVLAAAYVVALYGLGTITTNGIYDGVLGVILGLYLCAIPAKTFMDVLFADRFAAQRFWSNPPVLAMQGFTLVIGTLVIWAGMLCLMRA